MGSIFNESCDVSFNKFKEVGIKVDLILTDPPYNIGKDFGNDTDKMDLDDFISLMRERIVKCADILSESGSILWFSSHQYVHIITDLMLKAGLYYRRMNIWYYENGMSRQVKEPITQYEPFLWFSKSDRVWTYNVDDVRVLYKSQERLKNPVFKTNSSGVKVGWTPNPSGAKRGDVWKYPALAGKLYQSERTEHPTQKPESLITDLIKAFFPKVGDVYKGVLYDPFLGSGTTVVCAERLNLLGNEIDWFGSEIETNWCMLTRDRLRSLSKGALF